MKYRININLTQAFMFIIRAALICTASIFILRLIEEYYEGKTSFNAFERPLIAEDVPSLTVCFYGTISLQYEKDVSISVFKGDRVADSKLQLAYGTNSMSVSNFIHLKRLFLRPPFDHSTTCLNLNFEFKKENFERTLKKKAIWDRSLGLGMFKILLPKQTKYGR